MLTIGLVLVLVGVILVVAETQVASGALGGGGLLALAAGIVLAVVGADGGLVIALALAAATLAAGGALLVLTARKVAAAHRALPAGDARALVGCTAVVRTWQGHAGQVAVRGEVWRARLSLAQEEERPPRPGEPVVVEAVHDLTLSVRKAEPWEL